MQSTDLHQAEKLLQNLTHDLRQSLGTIGVSAYILNQSLPAADVHARAHIRTIERQVEAASKLLRDAMVAMRERERAQLGRSGGRRESRADKLGEPPDSGSAAASLENAAGGPSDRTPDRPRAGC
jgi:signal transduction histidine kinase